MSDNVERRFETDTYIHTYIHTASLANIGLFKSASRKLGLCCDSVFVCVSKG